MAVGLEDLVHFGHVVAAIVGLMLAGVLHTALIQLRKARTTSEIRPWAPVIGRIEPLLPVFALLLLVSGLWLIHLSHGEFSVREGWVVTSIAALVGVEALGGSLAPRSATLRKRIREAPEGPVPAEVRAAALDPVFWYIAHLATAVFFGIVFLMVVKPSGTWSVVTIVVAGLIGILTAVPFTKAPGWARAEPSPEVGRTANPTGAAEGS